MQIRRLGCALLLVLAPALAHATSSLQVALTLAPSQTLAGIPVSLRLTFTNSSDSAVSIPRRAVLSVTNKQSGEFLAWWDQAKVAFTPAWGGTPVPPHGLVVEDLATDGSLLTPAWFLDSRLLRSGTYMLQVFLADDLSDDVSLDAARTRALATTSATLIVAQPTGIDLEAWKLLLSAGEPWGPTRLATPKGAQVVRDIVTKHAKSAYAGWVATTGFTGSTEERASLLRTWLENDTAADPYYEQRILKLAMLDVALWDQMERSDPAKSRQHGALARAALNRLVQQTKNENVKRAALDQLDYLNDSQ